MQITTRAASLADVDFLIGLLGDGHRPDALDQIHGRIENSITYVVFADDQPVGRLRLVRTDHHIEIAGIQIDPKRQSQGIGTAVINQVLDEARSTGVPVELDVNKDNRNAERLYTRLGFRRLHEDGNDYRMTTCT
jgi:ribosomal protein S18 acetylase RimI-like enzyme